MKRCRDVAILATGACLLFSINGFAQSIDAFGFRDFTTFEQGISDGTAWPLIAMQRPALADCEEAYRAYVEPETARPAKERYRLVRRYRECLGLVRTSAVASATDRTADVMLAFQVLDDGAEKKEETAKASKDFMGMAFGVGVGASFASDDRISAAEVGADGRIRPTTDNTNEPRVVLESHYYGFCKSDSCNAGRFGFGPYFGIVAKDDKLISAFSVGLMFGWKPDDEKSDGFSVGIGAILDSDIKSLAPGFEEGQPLPAGETAIAFEEKSRSAAILFFTKTF